MNDAYRVSLANAQARAFSALLGSDPKPISSSTNTRVLSARSSTMAPIRASTAFVTSSARSGACDSGELLVSELHANSTYNRIRGSSMSKTPTEELEVVTMRLPSPLLDRARKDSEERGRPFAHSIRAALEIFFFHNVAREMAQTMTDDMKELGLNREDYFR